MDNVQHPVGAGYISLKLCALPSLNLQNGPSIYIKIISAPTSKPDPTLCLFCVCVLVYYRRVLIHTLTGVLVALAPLITISISTLKCPTVLLQITYFDETEECPTLKQNRS